MRAVIQRVECATVSVGDTTVGSIGPGFLVLLGIHRDDTVADAEYIADKTVGLRVFADREGKMNLSLLDIGGSALIISQFTLYGDVRRGRRPSFVEAADPTRAVPLYEMVCCLVAERGVHVERGVFGAMMKVCLINDGPVTIQLDSRKLY